MWKRGAKECVSEACNLRKTFADFEEGSEHKPNNAGASRKMQR